jgi:WD40 repeat protein
LWKLSGEGRDRTLLGHKDRVWSVAFSPDGHRLASACEDGTVKIWSLGDESPRRFASAPTSFESPAFTSSGAQLVAGVGETLGVWNVSDHSLAAEVPISQRGTLEIAASPDNRMVATRRGLGETVQLWQLPTLEQITELPVVAPSNSALAWAPEGHRLAYAVDETTVVVHNIDSGEIERRFPHTTPVRYLAFTPDGRYLASTSQSLEIRDVHTGHIACSVPGAHAGVVVARDRSLIAAACGSNVTLVDLTSEDPQVSTLVTIGSDVTALAIDGNTLAIGFSTPALVSLWDLRTEQVLMRLNCDLEKTTGLAFSPDGRRLVATGRTADGSGRILEWAIHEDRPSRRGGF